jgi:spore coat protein CotF
LTSIENRLKSRGLNIDLIKKGQKSLFKIDFLNKKNDKKQKIKIEQKNPAGWPYLTPVDQNIRF